MKYEGLQPKLRDSTDPISQEIGKFGCYFLSLFQIAELVLRDEDYEKVLSELYYRYQKFGLMDHECTILNGPAILKDLTGDTWKLEKLETPVLPTIPPYGAEIINQYQAFSGKGYHFRYMPVDTEIERNRILVGYRIYTRV
ncbi:hypothetical protein FACS189479_04340 [Spirochaetia bacterium]|nr:hypothetical protein FACS189479_04340 [Spirochaetia bacterium]